MFIQPRQQTKMNHTRTLVVYCLIRLIHLVHRLVCCLVFCIAVGGCTWQQHHLPYESPSAYKPGEILHVTNGTRISKEQLGNVLKDARIVYVGEVEESPSSQEIEYYLLQALDKLIPGNLSVGMEMFDSSSQEVADRWVSGKLDRRTFANFWRMEWGDNFSRYYPLLKYIQRHKIPIVALRAPQEWIKRVNEVQVKGETLGSDMPELDLTDTYHRTYALTIFNNQRQDKAAFSRFEPFYRLQVLRDEAMAAKAVQYLDSEEGRGKQLLILAGLEHIQYGVGVPRRAFRRLPLSYATVVPEVVEAGFDIKAKPITLIEAQIPLPPAEFLWYVGATGSEEQKVYLGVVVDDAEAGVEVLKVIEKSPAEMAGIQVGDIVFGMDEKPIETTMDLVHQLLSVAPGSTARVKVKRQGQELHLNVTYTAKSARRSKLF